MTTDEALNAKEEVSCATDEIKLWLVASVDLRSWRPVNFFKGRASSNFLSFPLKNNGACYAGWLLQLNTHAPERENTKPGTRLCS